MRYAAAVLTLLLTAAATVYLVFRPKSLPVAAGSQVIQPATQPSAVPALTPTELGNFAFDEHNPVIPASVQAMNGSSIRLRGRMIPLDQSDKMRTFALVPPLPPQPLFSPCGAGVTPPLIQQTIIVNCPNGGATYCPDEVVVEGKLAVGLIKDDGFITGIFSVDMSSVTPAAK